MLVGLLTALAIGRAETWLMAASTAGVLLGVLGVIVALYEINRGQFVKARLMAARDTDALTGLANRGALLDHLAAAVESAQSLRRSLALFHLDLDGFKDLNDLHGHAAGDTVLKAAAERIKREAGQGAVIGRLAGDEFMIVEAMETEAAASLAARLTEALKGPVAWDGRELAIGASVGVTMFPQDGGHPEDLIAHARTALDRAKQGARGAWRFFSRETEEQMRLRRQTARELRRAISEGELVVHYQPLARATDTEVCGFEALVRWNHPDRGMVPPMEFIPLAEEMGLIGALGDWVLAKACADAAAWVRPLSVAVNLSAVQLHQPDLPERIGEILGETGLPPARLELEVTETALIEDTQTALATLRRIKSLGVHIAMDDFGTGFSSLSTLQSFPFDKLKIDKTFVGALHADERGAAIVRAVLGLGKSLAIPVTAEGVETQAQLEFLRGEECAQVQGWLIGRPAPVETLFPWTGPDGPPQLKEAS